MKGIEIIQQAKYLVQIKYNYKPKFHFLPENWKIAIWDLGLIENVNKMKLMDLYFDGLTLYLLLLLSSRKPSIMN